MPRAESIQALCSIRAPLVETANRDLPDWGAWPQGLEARLSGSPVVRFRHRSLFILFSRPCRAALSERFLSGRTHFSYFSVQKHWKQKFSSMRDSIFPEILFLEGRECAQSKILYRILGSPGRNSNKTSYLFPALWTLFFLKWLSVLKTFLGTGWQLTLLNLDNFQFVEETEECAVSDSPSEGYSNGKRF